MKKIFWKLLQQLWFISFCKQYDFLRLYICYTFFACDWLENNYFTSAETLSIYVSKNILSVKFRFSKKATKFETISHMIWCLLSKCQIKWDIVSNFWDFLRMSELYIGRVDELFIYFLFITFNSPFNFFGITFKFTSLFSLLLMTDFVIRQFLMHHSFNL